MEEEYSMLGYQRLAAAIVEQAARDAVDDSGKPVQIVRKFFCDANSMFQLYMPNSDGRAVYKQILENYKKHGNFVPPGTKLADRTMQNKTNRKLRFLSE